ncbi:MAG: AMIN domain-containing protein [Candidatus Edwardsbacteria bacterium]|nr:AMIN domain-containing protein [Candidatus Edwardsbacteria bacterium]MBU1577671.1 AMIN domain-containing protein [Candidatus Edwardsbacteria bacterium]MBU2463357.1 AMIN domain-containing protein [Candidatus Edwardsbacteria bacterium]MBU2594568.1 AMIN domain-containing protein [Candidatus Edwardsbacteria bacterium]
MSYHRSNKILPLAAAVLLSVFSLANAAKVLDIAVKKSEGVTQVVITGDDILDSKDFTLSNPDRLVVDIKGASIAFGNKTMTVNKGGITTISTSQFDREGGIARIVIEMGVKPNYLLMTEENDIIVALTTKDTSPFAEWKATAAPSEMAVATTTPQSPVPPSMPAPPPPMVEETPVVPVTSTPPPSTPTLVMEEQPAAPVVPMTPTPAAPSTPPPVIEEIPAAPIYAAAPTPPAPPEKLALPATPIQPRAAYVESQKPRYRSASTGGLSGGRSVSMELESADVITVLRAMAEYSGRNLIVGNDVKGSVSMRLHNVPWARAFEEIVKAAGLVVEESSGIIRVMSPKQATENMRMREQGQELVTVVYPIEYAVANEIIGSLNKILSSRGSIQVDKRTNALVINEVSFKQVEIAELIKLLDTATLQVEIMARIVDVDMDVTKDLGINWNVSNIASYDANVELQNASVPQLLPAGTRPSMTVGTIRSFAQISATLTVLEAKRKANTISNPRITTVNNKEAKIVGGKKIPISLRDESGNTVTSMYTIGMVLTTTPHINSAENITLDVKTEISDLDPTATILGGVVILTNEASTQIVLNDGETAVIGGLLQTKAGKASSGIPILMDIPFIGALFRSTTTSTAKREILIFLTPHIIKSK